MSYDEIRAELLADYPSVVRKLNYLSDSFGSLVKKVTRQFPIEREYEYVTHERNNHFYFVLSANKRSDWSNPRTTVFATWESETGKYAGAISVSKEKSVMIFRPHVFQRYRERYVKDQQMSNDAVIRQFLRRNHTCALVYVSDDIFPEENELESSERKCAYLVNEGVAFGEASPTLTLFRTFVTYDMLYPNQKEALLPLRDKYLESVRNGL